MAGRVDAPYPDWYHAGMVSSDELSPEGSRQRSLTLLEFNLVRERLAQCCTFSPAREQALALEPSFDRELVVRAQEETSEAKRFLERGSSIDLSMARDISALVQRATLGGMLRGDELRQVADTSRAARLAKASLEHRRDLPILHHVGSRLSDLNSLERELDSSIGTAGEILDSAGPFLGSLRSEVREAHQRLNDSLQRAVRRLQRQGVLQEPLVTERNGRLVLMVKAEMKHRLQGIVHDASDSGATVFVEPLSAVALGNEWRELRLAVEREEERILTSLSQLVGAWGDELSLAVELLCRLDLSLAKGRYSLALKAQQPSLVDGDRPFVRLVEARHPLLEGSIVPITLTVGDPQQVLLITGPNAGGKTVALKSVGLAVLMAQAGLHVAAAEATLGMVDGVFADIGDQQSIQRSLSTFSSHIENLRDILQQATPSSLVLLDELGTSTDPEEGAALAKAVLAHFARRGTTLVATSHFRGVAAFVQEEPNMINASVELDPVTLEPTYRLTTGLPGRSYALTIAAHHGLDPAVVEGARPQLAPLQEGSERLMQELEQERHLAEKLRQEAEALQAEVKERATQLEEQLAAMEDSKAQMLEETQQQLQEKAAAVMKRLNRAERAVARAQRPSPLARPVPREPEPVPEELEEQAEDSLEIEEEAPEIEEALEEVGQVRQELDAAEWRPPPSRREDWLRQLTSGDRVYLRGLPQPVEVIAPVADGSTLEVLLGTMRARIPVYQVDRPAEAHATAARHGVFLSRPVQRQARTELDLRGQRVEDALEQVETLIDEASLGGTSTLRIIHGVGTGALRTAIRDYLLHHPLVRDFHRDERTAADGATMVELT